MKALHSTKSSELAIGLWCTCVCKTTEVEWVFLVSSQVKTSWCCMFSYFSTRHTLDAALALMHVFIISGADFMTKQITIPPLVLPSLHNGLRDTIPPPHRCCWWSNALEQNPSVKRDRYRQWLLVIFVIQWWQLELGPLVAIWVQNCVVVQITDPKTPNRKPEVMVNCMQPPESLQPGLGASYDNVVADLMMWLIQVQQDVCTQRWSGLEHTGYNMAVKPSQYDKSSLANNTGFACGEIVWHAHICIQVFVTPVTSSPSWKETTMSHISDYVSCVTHINRWIYSCCACSDADLFHSLWSPGLRWWVLMSVQALISISHLQQHQWEHGKSCISCLWVANHTLCLALRNCMQFSGRKSCC